MRKWIAPHLFLGALALSVTPSHAVISGTSHDVGTGVYQPCSVCHIPHRGKGARLWPVTPPNGLRGTIANLCGTCHHSTGTYAGSFAPTSPASNNYVYGIRSHGHPNQMVIASAPAGSTVEASGLPHTTGTDLECTSCHNVHNDPSDGDETDADEFRPFLRDSLESICLRCHGSRQAGFASPTVFGAWDTAEIRLTNPGLHPFGTNITGDVTIPGNSPIVWGANIDTAQSAVAGQWSMGGHRSPGGAVICSTCHAVHGRQWDTQAGAAPAGFTDNIPVVDMLAVNQGTGWNPNVNDGDESFNYLCEACHAGNETVYASAAFNWNPGGTPYAHPVDDKGATGSGNFSTSFPANWPNGGTITTWIRGTNAASPVPICESCHSPHAAVNAGRADLDATAGPFILRTTASLCDGCHNGTAAISQHHPVVRRDTGSSASGVAGVAYLTTNTTLGCGTCHEAGTMDNTIHNWAADGRPSNLPMRTGWRPANNGRTDATYPIFGTGSAGDYLPSTTCMDCHLALTRSINVSTRTATDNEYQVHGTGSHFVGTSLRSWFGAKTLPFGGASFNVATDNWSVATSAPFTGAAARSVFGEGDGSTTYNVVCESCHNLDPDKNVAGTKLLLGSYTDGAANENAQLCEGCHGTPAGTHPLTGDTVGTGGNHPLSTSGANFIAPPAGSGPTVGTNQVSCDSCHQPHSAATAGVALIIDTASANIVAPAQAAVNVTLPGVLGGTGTVSQRRYNAAVPANLPAFNAFCAHCHPF